MTSSNNATRVIEEASMVERDEATLASSFEVFHRDHRDRLVASLALHLQDAHLAAEAVDHAMANAWGRWDDLDDHGDAGGADRPTSETNGTQR